MSADQVEQGRGPFLSDGSILVELRRCTEGSPVVAASEAAQACYSNTTCPSGKTLDVEGTLFRTGHHTTMEHSYFTFVIEGIAIGDVTFGLHLTHPFYNTDQRSGRFCGEMFSNPDMDRIRSYIETYWPEIGSTLTMACLKHVETGVYYYQHHLVEATHLAEVYLEKERPHATPQLLKNARKIAQEQLRMFIPIIMPTALHYTIDLITLLSLWECAWTPVLRSVTELMRRLVVKKFPEVAFAFKEERRLRKDWSPRCHVLPFMNKVAGLLPKPQVHFAKPEYSSDFPANLLGNAGDKHPVDRLPFLPGYMNNNQSSVVSAVTVSIATMGQDQRHRTISRSEPVLTGQCYLPPLLARISGAGAKLQHLMLSWHYLNENLPGPLATLLLPYGAMVRYEKRANVNALAHEQAKRLCWSAQEEIFHLSLGLRNQLVGRNCPFIDLLEPPCYRTGKCGEGARYCGRGLSLCGNADKFFGVERTV